MGCYLGGYDSLLDIVYIWQGKVLCWCYVTEECCAVHGCDRSAYGTCDVIVSRCYICDKRSKYVEWCAHTECLLNFHVGCNLIEWHMTRALNHNLYVMIPRALCQLSKSDKLLYLTYIRCVRKTSRTTCISK